MNRAGFSLAALAAIAILGPGCTAASPTIGGGKRLVVELTNGNLGTPDQPLPISVVQPTTFTVNITAELPDGSTDTSFNGYVNVIAQPGSVSNLDITNIQLQNGVYQSLQVPVVAAFGETHIWADDLGYTPAPPNRNPPPECANGIDDNHNGLIDYPADPGCYSPTDDTEDLGTYASGSSDTIYFQLPRIQLVRGYDPADNGNGNKTLFPNTQVSIDTGWRGGSTYDFSTIVIGLTSAGFYVQDLQSDENPAPGYGGVYAYNFETPAFMRVCDRVQVLSGTSSDFYGFTELNYPTWQLEYWDPTQRPCLVPEPTVLGVADLNNDNTLWQNEATLVRVESAGTVTVTIASHFGPEDVPIVNGNYVPSDDASNCDYDHDGKINYADAASTPSEANCAAVCTGNGLTNPPTDYDCSEYSQYASENDFFFVVTDSSNNSKARIQGDASAADLFDPVSARGSVIGAFTGLVSYFSGGTQFTIQARCQDDVVPDRNTAPATSNVACVHPRTSSAINANSQ
ncbi:MAG TPA: hypothetical protein VGG39_27275 [Polyangiaceae bacterium]|jgi:hypothetical protein